MDPTFCERCNRRTIDLFGGLCIDCHEELPGGNPGKSPRPAAPEPTGAGPTPRNTSS